MKHDRTGRRRKGKDVGEKMVKGRKKTRRKAKKVTALSLTQMRRGGESYRRKNTIRRRNLKKMKARIRKWRESWRNRIDNNGAIICEKQCLAGRKCIMAHVSWRKAKVACSCERKWLSAKMKASLSVYSIILINNEEMKKEAESRSSWR